MLLDSLENNGKHCMGCSACKTICPVQAISFETDSYGFYKAKIDEARCIKCGKCESVCPQLNYEFNNLKVPTCYAVKADAELLGKSSSGGAFGVLAEYTLNNNGLVCGAVYDPDFRGVSLKIASTKEDVAAMHGSKYVYSKPQTILADVKKKLDDGLPILFSGLPCQVAALNNVLGKEYDNLITVDLICTGVPSEKVFNAYLDQLSNGKEIVSVNMRPKKYGWEEDGIEILFREGSEYMVHGLRDPYLKGYLRGLFRADACYDCKYGTMPRVADFTIGDFWHADKILDEDDFSDGISCILLNNEKAQNCFENIKDSFSFIEEVPASFLRRFNMFAQKRKEHLGRSRFFDMINSGVPFKKAVKDCLEWRFDVAVSGSWTVPNYGGELTYYALYNTLKDMGKTVIMVERRANIPGYDVPKPNGFRINPYPFYDISRIHKSFNDQQELNLRIKNYVLGSDQIWNYKLMGTLEDIKSWSFDYAAPYRNKVAYASSFGADRFTGPDDVKKEYSSMLKRFNHISVREKSGVSIVREIADMEAVYVVDPALLCRREYFDKLASRSLCRDKDYVFAYFINPEVESDQNRFKNISLLSDRLTLGLRVCINLGTQLNNMAAKNIFPFPYENNLSVEDWVYFISHSSYVVTTSFHALCFSIIYHKPFVFLKGNMTDEYGFDRIRTILSMADLEDRVFKNIDEALNSDILTKEINWDRVSEKLKPEIDRSRKWLEDSLV